MCPGYPGSDALRGQTRWGLTPQAELAAFPARWRYCPATVETYSATAAICCGVSWPLNDGITLLPFVTRSTTRDFGGLASSRFGPTVPVEPASFRVWQLVQPTVANTCLPCATSADPPPPPVVVVACVVVVGGGAVVVVAPVVAPPAGSPATEAT